MSNVFANLRLPHQIFTRGKMNNAIERLTEQHTFAITKLALPSEDIKQVVATYQPGGALAICPSPTENFKTLHSNFDICRNFQRIKMKLYILIFFWIFLSHWLIVSFKDLSWDRSSDRKLRKWLVFKKICSNCENVGNSLKCWYF